MGIQIREAGQEDVEAVVQLSRELAEAEGEAGSTSPDDVIRYLAHPDSCILLAVSEERVLGLLSYSIRPDLFHASDCCSIEALIVQEQVRGQGVGSALLQEAIHRAESSHCAEISVSTMPDNQQAISFYRRHGLVDEAILLERHL